ncbi:hypothetical protein GGP81_003082 [Salinibacter ruber]|nr:hypothetical protein [Salinibacter ruber]
MFLLSFFTLSITEMCSPIVSSILFYFLAYEI